MLLKSIKKNNNLKSLIIVTAISALFFTSCSDDDLTAPERFPQIANFEPKEVEPGDSVTITGVGLDDINEIRIGNVDANIISQTNDSIVITVPTDTETGRVTGIFDGGSGSSSTNIALTVLDPDTDTDTDMDMDMDTDMPPATTIVTLDALSDDFESLLGGQLSHGSDAEISVFGNTGVFNSTGMTIPANVPEEVAGNFYFVSGISDTSDSGSFTGLIGTSEQAAGTYADFFNDEDSRDINNVYFNLRINFGEIPEGYDDVLAGIRFRFDQGYDADGDGSNTDEVMEYRPTPSNLAELGFAPDANGWYAISVPLVEFKNAGASGGSWDLYQREDLTRIAIASRRNYDGEYSLSIDDVSITKGGPAVFPTTTPPTTTPPTTIETLDTLSDDFENLLGGNLSSGGDLEAADVGNSGIVSPLPANLPTAIDGNFYFLSGISDTGDSGSFTGIVGTPQQAAGTYANFFNDDTSRDVENIYFNLRINFGDIPMGYDDELAGLRFRFDDGYDADSDNNSSDELMEYRATPSDLAAKGFAPDADGWYSISISLDQFENPGASGGSWDLYQVEDVTRIAIASRRKYDGEYSLSIDDVSITKGGPVFPTNL